MSVDKYYDLDDKNARVQTGWKDNVVEPIGPKETFYQIRSVEASEIETLPVAADNGGLRFNDGKPRFDLLPPEALIALADHYRRGAEKYADRNWERGMDWGKCFASMERHAWAWQGGEDLDPETGSHHMISVAWNAFALYTYAMREIGVDNRVKINE